MTNDELQTLRLLIREEVGTAIYASEQRIGEHIDTLAHRMDRFEVAQKQMQADLNIVKADLNIVKADLNGVKADLEAVKATQRQMQSDLEAVKATQRQMQSDLLEAKLNYVEIKSTLFEVVAILDQATVRINEIWMNNIKLDKSLEENIAKLWREVQLLAAGFKEFNKEIGTIARLINSRLAEHENLPFDQAHRRHGAA